MRKALPAGMALVLLVSAADGDGPNLVRGAARAPHRGVYEVVLEAAGAIADPHGDPELRVTFVRPDRSKAAVDGFFDGEKTFRARAYCDQTGKWTWSSAARAGGLDGRSGSFEVAPSKLPGKLRQHPKDPRQFACDNGEWFLHIGDTGYRYVTDTEPEWKAYIDQAARAGFTKVRTWFCRSRGGVEALFAKDRSALDLDCWREIDRRLQYALDRHPGVQFQLIPFGEDTAELLRYAKGDRMSLLAARHAQARWSAFPNVHWCVSNDRHVQGELIQAIDRIARDMAEREPWGTLLTNHQRRRSGYAFTDAPWSDIITLEDIDQVDGKVCLEYRARGNDPVVLDEDRYEIYKGPAHPRYFFRRLMWASLLSGAHATYGGLNTYEAHDGPAGIRGVRGYEDAKKSGKLKGGADDFVHIQAFFRDAGITLAGMEPDDAAAGGDPAKAKCAQDGRTVVVYLANPDGPVPEKADAAAEAPSVPLRLPQAPFTARWFDPRAGSWKDGGRVGGGAATLKAPGPGDWVLLLVRA